MGRLEKQLEDLVGFVGSCGGFGSPDAEKRRGRPVHEASNKRYRAGRPTPPEFAGHCRGRSTASSPSPKIQASARKSTLSTCAMSLCGWSLRGRRL